MLDGAGHVVDGVGQHPEFVAALMLDAGVVLTSCQATDLGGHLADGAQGHHRQGQHGDASPQGGQREGPAQDQRQALALGGAGAQASDAAVHLAGEGVHLGLQGVLCAEEFGLHRLGLDALASARSR